MVERSFSCSYFCRSSAGEHFFAFVRVVFSRFCISIFSLLEWPRLCLWFFWGLMKTLSSPLPSSLCENPKHFLPPQVATLTQQCSCPFLSSQLSRPALRLLKCATTAPPPPSPQLALSFARIAAPQPQYGRPGFLLLVTAPQPRSSFGPSPYSAILHRIWFPCVGDG